MDDSGEANGKENIFNMETALKQEVHPDSYQDRGLGFVE